MTPAKIARHQPLRAQVQTFIAQHQDIRPATETAFNALVGEVFAWQYAEVAPYRRLCEARGVTPLSWDGAWQSIPAVPAEAFKQHDLFAWDLAIAQYCFQTSGTTAGAARGRHFMRDSQLYDLGAAAWWQSCLLPDAPRTLCPVLLAPSPLVVPDSSLGHMLATVIAEPPETMFFLGPDGIDVAGVERALLGACAAEQPVLLAATSYALAWWLEHAAWDRALPDGSRVMETGGFKRHAVQMSAADVPRIGQARLGIPASHWVSEYGMTELSSQCYSACLRAAIVGDVAADGLIAPPWMRVQIVDPSTGGAMAAGEVGLIQLCDLANVDSVAAIYTQDLGVILANGALELRGRMEQAPERGCSLTALEMLGGSAG